MRNQRLAALIGMVGFLGAAAFACSSSTPPTDFGGSDNGNSSNGNSSNGSNNSGYGGTSTSNHTSNNGNNTSNNNTSNNNTSNNNTSNNNTSNNNTSTPVNTGGGGCGDAGGSCSAPSSGGLALSNGCMQTGLGSGGYAYSYGDYQKSPSCATAGSTSCVSTSSLCAAGTTAPAGSSYTCYGNGFGFDLTETATAASVKATGLSFTLTGTLPAGGGQVIVVDSTGTDYCALFTKTGAQTIPWSGFNTLCYNNPPDGGTFMMSDTITKINFQVSANQTATQTWSLCASAISF